MTETAGGLIDGNDAAGVPDHRLSLGAEWDAPRTPMTPSGRVIHSAEQFADADNTQELPSWTRVDPGVHFVRERAGGAPITMRAGLENALGADYWASAAGGRAAGIARGAPRTATISASHAF